MDVSEDMEAVNPADEEDKLLAGESDEDMEGAKIDNENEVLDSDSDHQQVESSGINKDSEESDSSDDDGMAAAEAEVLLIQNTLSQNPYDYDSHKMLIEKLHQMGELDRLREARENMSSKFPLTSEIWLSWLTDEMQLAATPESKAAVLELCERAVNDYLSVEVWLEYLQYITQYATQDGGLQKIRSVFEKALTAAGLHVMKGSLIWDAFREFEKIVLMFDLSEPEKIQQTNRIGKLYKRQLACPLYGMEKTFEEYKVWRSSEGCDCTEDDKIIQSGYERALSELAMRIPFEEKLELADNKDEQLDIYKAYLLHEKQVGDPGRITILYERAVSDLSLEPVLWTDYTQYVQNNIKIYDIVEKVYTRAVKNVSWCVKLWQAWIRFYEKNNCPLSEVLKVFENALSVGFSTPAEYKDIWMTYLEYLRRGLNKAENEDKHIEIVRNAFNQACEHLAGFGLEGDPGCDILQFWARFEAIHANDMEKSRKLWADIMSQGHSDSYASWLEYISLERCYGDTKHLRKLFPKALASSLDWPESIASAWLNFERDEGTLEQMEICEIKVKERLDKVAEERKKVQENQSKSEEFPNKKVGKRKLEDGGKWKELGASSSKVSKVLKPSKPSEKEITLDSEINTNLKESEKAVKPKGGPPPGYTKTDEVKMQEDSHDFQKVDENITVFVSNLDYTTSEEEVREALKTVGPITMFRMVKDYKGRSKGFCYVQFKCAQDVSEALKLDRTRINGRPMFISRCDPDKTSRNPVFKYKTVLEKNKLFVKGLPTSMTKEELEKIFKVHGELKDVRIVTYRNGHSKGLAYVDFADEISASKALVATDGMIIDDKVLSVAISQPPQRKATAGNDESHQIKSLGGSSQSRVHFGNPKTILSMVPRVVKQTTTKSDSVSGNGVGQPMSNQDFRSMLLNKK